MTLDGTTQVKFVALRNIMKDKNISHYYNGFDLEWRSKNKTGWPEISTSKINLQETFCFNKLFEHVLQTKKIG